jgi:hypothetical protein
MVELKRIGGIILIGLALLFAFRIPGHLASSDPHQQSLAHADYFFVFVLGASGLVLLFSPNLKPAGTSQRKKIRPLSIALQGIFLILFCFIFSFRNNVLFAGKIIVPGRVAAVDQPATRPSGKTAYHVTYEYTDIAGINRIGYDTAYSSMPILPGSAIEVAYSPYRPTISRLASRFNSVGIYVIFMGLLYVVWALFLFARQRKQIPTSAQPPA